MTFRIAQTPTFTWPVKIPVAKDGGTVVDEELTVRFKRLNVDEIEHTVKENNNNLRGLARAVTVGWSGVEDDTGPVVFSAETFDALLAIPGAAAAIVGAWMDANTGARQKN